MLIKHVSAIKVCTDKINPPIEHIALISAIWTQELRAHFKQT